MRSALLLFTIALASACGPAPGRDALPVGTGVTPDSLRAAFHAWYGPVPTRLSRCGSRHLLVAFLDAPGDVRDQSKRVPGGREFSSNALIDRGRGGLAEELASIAVAALPATAPIDTISVQLDHSASSVQYHFAIDRNARTGGIDVRRIQTGLDWCLPVA